MQNEIQVCMPPRFETVEQVLSGLGALETAFVAAGDRRGVFTTAYVVTTTTLNEWIQRREFCQNDSVFRYVVAFANAYRDALEADANGASSIVPIAWRQSFGSCRHRRTSIFNDLLLGINAHVNHDLPHAVLQAGLNVNCNHCYSDHTRMNDALREATPQVRTRVARNYSRWLNLASWICGRSIDSAVAKMFERARENSWVAAKVLAHARGDEERRNAEWMISRRAEAVGEQILMASRRPVAALSLLSETKNYQEPLAAPFANNPTLANLCPQSIG